jgi:DNA-binding NarL/FixJ family response regulator
MPNTEYDGTVAHVVDPKLNLVRFLNCSLRNVAAPEFKGAFVRKASILLADDNSAVVDHVSSLLEADEEYEVVGALNDGTAVSREYERLRPDVIVLDISMEPVSGIDVARHLRDCGCPSKIVFLTVHEDADFVAAAMGAGGSAYVVKSRLGMDLIPAIHAALCNKFFVSPNLLYQQP